MYVAQHAKIILLIFKVAEGGKEAAGQIKTFRANKFPHILLDPFDCGARLGRVLTRLCQQKWRTVNACDFESPLSKLNGVASWTAAEIEHAAAAALCQGKNTADFLRRGGKPLGGKHKGI